MCKCINRFEVGVIVMEIILVNKCLIVYIIELDINKWRDMVFWFLVCYIFKGIFRGVINEYLKKDGYLDWFVNIILKVIFSFWDDW